VTSLAFLCLFPAATNCVHPRNPHLHEPHPHTLQSSFPICRASYRLSNLLT
jgi:hypothetical protein